MNYRKTVVGVVYQEKEFLLVQKPHWNGWWDFPQGGVKKGESLEQALKRELPEELGINKFGEPINTNLSQKRNFSLETLKYYPDRGYIGKELFYYIVPFIGDREKIVLGDDLCAQKWCNEEELLNLIYKELLDNTKQIVQFMKLNNLI